MRVIVYLHANIRTGANLVMLRHAGHLARRGHDVLVVFKHRFFDRALDDPRLAALFLDELDEGARAADAVLTNFTENVYDFPEFPARVHGMFRHGDERRVYNQLYDTHVFDCLIDMPFREKLHWWAVNDTLAAPVRAAGGVCWVLPNGVDVARFAAAQSSLPPATGLRVLVEGPVASAFKRVEPTIAMLRQIDGIEIVHMAADDSRPREPVAHALGAVAHDDVAAVYAGCDLIVKLSDGIESFSLPVLEQFAAGGTAVISAFPGHEQYVVDGGNALVVDLASPFAKAREAVLALRDDPARLARLRAAARETVARFDWQDVCDRFADQLEQAVGGSPALPARLALLESYRPCYQETLARWAQSRDPAPPSPPPPAAESPRRSWLSTQFRRK